MEPLTMGAIMGGTSLISGLMGGSAAKKAAKAQAAQMAQITAMLNGISVPEATRLVVEELQSQGQLTPDMQEALEQLPSELAQVSEDPSIRGNQIQALELIKQRAEGGLSFEDRAAYNEMRNAVQRDQQAKQAQLLQQMQARGMGGSGAELAMQIAQSQGSAQDASEQADRLAAQASRNALAAIGQMGSQSGQLRSQDFDVASTKARAQDEYNRFDVTARQNVANQNVAMRNAAQERNLAEKQRLADVNVANRRAEDIRFEDAKQQEYQNKLDKARIVAGAMGNQAQANAAVGQQRASQIGAIGSGITGALGAYQEQKNYDNLLEKFAKAGK